MHDTLFQPLKLGAIEAKNRILMAPLTRGRSTQPGSIPNEMMATYYRQRAGAGLIISEATGISVEGTAGPQRRVSGATNRSRGWKQVMRRRSTRKAGLSSCRCGKWAASSSPPVLGEAAGFGKRDHAPGHAHTFEGRKDHQQARAATKEDIAGRSSKITGGS